MAALGEIATKAVSASCPLLLLDTCAILDIVQGPERLKASDLTSALKVFTAASETPPACLIVRSSQIQREFDDHAENCSHGATGYLKRLKSDLEFVDTVSQAASISSQFIIDTEAVIQFLLTVASDAINRSWAIDSDPTYRHKAADRSLSHMPPARRGKDSLSDCVIFEEYLELCRLIRQVNVSIPIVFITGNVSDFCGSNKEFLPEIINEATPVRLSLVKTWGAAWFELFKRSRIA